MNPTGKGGFADHPEHIATTEQRTGRPKFSLVSIIRNILQEIPEGEKQETAERLIRAYVADAETRKDGIAIRDIIDRIDGRPKESVAIHNEMDAAWLEYLKVHDGSGIDPETTEDISGVQKSTTDFADS